MDPLTPERLTEIKALCDDWRYDILPIARYAMFELLTAYDALVQERARLTREARDRASDCIEHMQDLTRSQLRCNELKAKLAAAEARVKEICEGLTVKENMLTKEHAEVERADGAGSP